MSIMEARICHRCFSARLEKRVDAYTAGVTHVVTTLQCLDCGWFVKDETGKPRKVASTSPEDE